MICCDGGCDCVYHLDYVGLFAVPEGDWICPTCVSAHEKSPPKPAGGAVPLPGAVLGQPGVKPAAVGTNDGAPTNGGKAKRACPGAAVGTAATAAVTAPLKKPRPVAGDEGGGAGSGRKF